MEILISEATEKDIPSILELLYELERPSPVNETEIKIFKNKIKDYFLDQYKTIFVAKQDSKIVGLVSIILLRRLNRAKLELYIPELIVTKDLRNSGIGKKLISHCQIFAKKNDCYRIRLESENKRIESHRFYKSVGFEQSALSFSKFIL